MLVIPGRPGKDLCDPNLATSRRAILRAGSIGLFGMSLPNILRLQAAAADETKAKHPAAPGWNRAKSVVMIYLQGGPSHHRPLGSEGKRPGQRAKQSSRTSPRRSRGCSSRKTCRSSPTCNDRFTMIRSMNYTPNGLFNHTAAIYQMMTGYTTDRVSPSGQLEPPNAKDFPNFGSNIVRLKPLEEPMLPFVMLPRPLQESGVVGKGGTAGFLGRDYDPYTLYPDGDDLDMREDGANPHRRPAAPHRRVCQAA
jgi:hypothetical protein